jgi:hypothetical protein
MVRASRTLLAGLVAAAALTACTSSHPTAPGARSISKAASPAPASTGSPSPEVPPSAGPPPVSTPAPPPPGPASPPPAGTGVNGVTVMDRCPVARADPPCPPKPVPAHITVNDVATGAVITSFDSGNDGQFSVALKPGQYMLRLDRVAGAPPRRPQGVAVTVNAGRYTTLTIRIESGIQ